MNKVTLKAKRKKVYISVIEDKHYDTEIKLFSTYEKAKEYIDSELNNVPEEYKVEEFVADLLYHITYSIEGDRAYIMEDYVR